MAGIEGEHLLLLEINPEQGNAPITPVQEGTKESRLTKDLLKQLQIRRSVNIREFTDSVGCDRRRISTVVRVLSFVKLISVSGRGRNAIAYLNAKDRLRTPLDNLLDIDNEIMTTARNVEMGETHAIYLNIVSKYFRRFRKLNEGCFC